MVKIFVAQTHDKDRKLVCSFLENSGYKVEPNTTDPESLVWLARKISLISEPFVIVTSQTDESGCGYVSNMLHTVALSRPVSTLTIVYTRAAANQGNLPGVVHFIANLVRTPLHELRIIPKFAEDTREQEHEKLLSSITDFSASLNNS